MQNNLNIWGIEPQIFRQTKPQNPDVLSAINIKDCEAKNGQ